MNGLLLAALISDTGSTSTAAPDLLSLATTAGISGVVAAAIVTGIFQYINNRRNSRVTERRDMAVEENELIQRYKEYAAEERHRKESAISDAERSVRLYMDQVESLTNTITHLNHTIDLLQKNAIISEETIAKLTEDRDKLQKNLEEAQALVARQEDELKRQQDQIVELTLP